MSRTRHFDASRSSACRVVQRSSSMSGIVSVTSVPPSGERAPGSAFCSSPAGRPSVGSTTVDAEGNTAHMVVHTPEYRIHTYTVDWVGLVVKSYLFEAADGVVLVDEKMLQSYGPEHG